MRRTTSYGPISAGSAETTDTSHTITNGPISAGSAEE